MPAARGPRLGHLSIEVSNLKRAERFYTPFLGKLGFKPFVRESTYLGYWNGELGIWIIAAFRGRLLRKPPTGDEEVIADHYAFRLPTRAAVERLQNEFAQDELYPVFRLEEHPEFGRGYSSATWVDPDSVVWELYAIERPGPSRRAIRRRASGRRRR